MNYETLYYESQDQTFRDPIQAVDKPNIDCKAYKQKIYGHVNKCTNFMKFHKLSRFNGLMWQKLYSITKCIWKRKIG